MKILEEVVFVEGRLWRRYILEVHILVEAYFGGIRTLVEVYLIENNARGYFPIHLSQTVNIGEGTVIRTVLEKGVVTR